MPTKGLQSEARIGHECYSTVLEKTETGRRNAYRLAQMTDRCVRRMIVRGDKRISPRIILRFHKLSIQNLYSCAGQFRSWSVRINSSVHIPPPHRSVAGLVDAMCEAANEKAATGEWDAIEVAAYLLWRLNWIHPFGGGNGRTSRALSYLALCLHLGKVPEGKLSIAEQIDHDHARYQAALEDADAAWKEFQIIDVRLMIALLNDYLLKQIMSVD